MSTIKIISIIYLILGFILSFTLSFLYLRHYPKDDVKFAFYFSVFAFGLVIFMIFLIPYDAASSVLKVREGTTNILLDSLPIYYTIFGYFSQIIGEIVSPIMILILTSGFYKKSDIVKDVLYRFFTDFLSILKLIVVTVASLEAIHLYINGKDFFEILRDILIVLNFFPYLKILYYIGFVCQDLVYSNLKNTYELDRNNYDLWKLGKIYKHYVRERNNVDKVIDEIDKEIKEAEKHNIKCPPEFNDHLKTFQDRINEAKKNILIIHCDTKNLEMETNQYIEEEQKNKNDGEQNLIKDMFKEAKNEEDEALKKELGSDYKYIMGENNNDNLIPEEEYGEKPYYERDEENNLIPEKEEINEKNEDLISERTLRKYKNWNNFKIFICRKMTKAIEDSIRVKRKSYLIDLKTRTIFELFKGFKKTNCIVYFGIILFYIVLFFFEFPINIYLLFPNEIKKSFYGNLGISIISAIFYFSIFNYAIIHHRYTSGDLIFGKNESDKVNFYKFISFVLNYCDSIFFHSLWIFSKNNIYDDYRIEPKYFEVFNLPNLFVNIKNIFYSGKYYYMDLNIKIDLFPLLSLLFILISIFNAVKFSNIKICRKEIILFNENADFFYNEKNLYSNFILGCGCFIFICRNLIHLYRNEK